MAVVLLDKAVLRCNMQLKGMLPSEASSGSGCHWYITSKRPFLSSKQDAGDSVFFTKYGLALQSTDRSGSVQLYNVPFWLSIR